MSTATHTDAGILRVPVQIQKLPEGLMPEADMELSDDELEAVVGGLARAVYPAPLLSVAA
ncbi:MAG TPA: hypothetical protein VFJ16_09750 [Longimicrobium sp.]|nr:hypothetical protein [Longimicrobium sp.]